MPFTIDYQEPPGLIRLEIQPPDDLQLHLDARKAIDKLARQYNCLDILVDLSAMNAGTSMSREDQFTFSQSWKGGHYEGIQFAIILPENENVREDWYFIIHLITSMDIRGEVFTEIEDAFRWLKPAWRS